MRETSASFSARLFMPIGNKRKTNKMNFTNKTKKKKIKTKMFAVQFVKL